jgi:CheY-like chemotaxis protein
MSEAPRMQIVVVEDNPADVDLLRHALHSAGLDCELTVMDDGAEALALVRRSGKYAAASPPDLAIIDLNLPKHSGLEILEEMNVAPGFAELPVVVLSSSSSRRDRANIEKFPGRRFLTKPADLDEFLKIGLIVKELLNARPGSAARMRCRS